MSNFSRKFFRTCYRNEFSKRVTKQDGKGEDIKVRVWDEKRPSFRESINNAFWYAAQMKRIYSR